MQPHETEELKKFIRETIADEIQKAVEPMNKKLEPMYVVFSQAKGFNNVAIWLLKTLVIIGAAFAVVTTLVRWLRGH